VAILLSGYRSPRLVRQPGQYTSSHGVPATTAHRIVGDHSTDGTAFHRPVGSALGLMGGLVSDATLGQRFVGHGAARIDRRMTRVQAPRPLSEDAACSRCEERFIGISGFTHFG
jgi:hypothetical protein